MKKRMIGALLAMSGAAVLAANETPNEVQVRPGLWEVRLVKQTMDGRDITAVVPMALAGMQQLMGNLTPQQRQQVEATLGKPPAGTSQRFCVSPEMAKGDKPLLPPDVKCQPTAFDRSGSRVTFEFSCAEQGRTTVGKGESQLAAESVSTRIDMVTNDANGKHSWQNLSYASYMGTDCGALRPADQALREPPPPK